MAAIVGKGKRFAVVYTDVYGVLGTAGAKVNPTALTFSFEIVDAVSGAILVGPTSYVWQTDVQLVNDSPGTFHAVVVPSAAGVLRWKWVTPPNSVFPDVEQGSFLVVAQLF